MSRRRIDWSRFIFSFLLAAVPVGLFVTMLILRYGSDVRANVMVLVAILVATPAGILLGIVRIRFRG